MRLIAGEVRSTAFASQTVPGMHLLGTGYPVAQSPAERKLLPAFGSVASNLASESEAIREWTGDEDPGARGYRSYVLLDVSGGIWTPEGDASLQDVTDRALFRPGHAMFIRSRQADSSARLEASPWSP